MARHTGAVLVDTNIILDIALHPGEASLWADARSRDDAWILCGPDRASLRCGVRLGFRERLVSLERLLEDVGHRTRFSLRPAYTRSWLDRTLGELVVAETLSMAIENCTFLAIENCAHS